MNNMNIDEQLKQLAQQTCPKQVDVVDSVMAEVRKHPYLQPVATPVAPRKTRWVPWASLSAAAAVVGLVVLNFTPASAASYNEEQISSMMASVADYDYYSPVESSAENPIDYLYDDYENDN